MYVKLELFEFCRDVIRLSLKRVFLEHSSGRALCCMVWVMHRWRRGDLDRCVEKCWGLEQLNVGRPTLEKWVCKPGLSWIIEVCIGLNTGTVVCEG